MQVLYARCAGLDVHKDTVVAAVRLADNGEVQTEVRTFDTTTPGLLALSDWLTECGCTEVAMEATGVYWRPVWHVRRRFQLNSGQRDARQKCTWPQDRCRRWPICWRTV
jgi:hypothetical protein